MLVVSASAVARRVRTGEISEHDARAAFAAIDAFAARTAEKTTIDPADIQAASAALRRLDLTLCAPDAINVMMAQRTGAILMTFDVKMVASARALGVPVVPD